MDERLSSLAISPQFGHATGPANARKSMRNRLPPRRTITLQTVTTKSGPKLAPAAPAGAAAKAPDIAAVSIPDTLAALHVDADAGLTRAEVDTPSKSAWLQRSGGAKRAPVPPVPCEVLGPFGVDARTDHGAVAVPWEILRPCGGGCAPDPQRHFGLCPRAPRRRRHRNIAATPAGQRARAARVRTGRLLPLGNWSPAISSACAPATLSRRTSSFSRER